jgi:hypothetical protein
MRSRGERWVIRRPHFRLPVGPRRASRLEGALRDPHLLHLRPFGVGEFLRKAGALVLDEGRLDGTYSPSGGLRLF